MCRSEPDGSTSFVGAAVRLRPSSNCQRVQSSGACIAALRRQAGLETLCSWNRLRPHPYTSFQEMQSSATARTLATPELLERIVVHALISPTWQIDGTTARAVRAINRSWRDVTDVKIVREIWLTKTEHTYCHTSSFDVGALLEHHPALFSSIRTARLTRTHSESGILDTFDCQILRLSHNLRKLTIMDFTDLASMHAEKPLVFATLSSLAFTCSVGVRDATTRKQMNAFLVSLPSLTSLAIFFGYDDHQLPWFKLDRLLHGVTSRIRKLKLMASAVLVTVQHLKAALSMFDNVEKLHIVAHDFENCPRLLEALPCTIQRLSGLFNGATLYGILEDLAKPTLVPFLRLVPDIQEHPDIDALRVDPPEANMPYELVEQALVGLSKRGVIDLDEDDWRLWQLVPGFFDEDDQEESVGAAGSTADDDASTDQAEFEGSTADAAGDAESE